MSDTKRLIVDSLCMTWRHDFGLDNPSRSPLSSGMKPGEREGLRNRMAQLFEHHIAHLISERDQLRAELSRLKAGQGEAVALTVWYGSMPESNGKSNWTAILHRKGQCMSEGITISRSEYPERVRYEADELRHLIGELEKEPWILDYDADAHSGYLAPPTSDATQVMVSRELLERLGYSVNVESLVEASAELRALLAQEVK